MGRASARICVDEVEGSAGAARRCAVAVFEVRRAATRGCAALDVVAGKRDVVLVGKAFALAFASEYVVGMVIVVGTEECSRGCKAEDIDVVVVGMAGPADAELCGTVVRSDGNPRGLFFLGMGLAVSCNGGLEEVFDFGFLTGAFLGGMMKSLWPYRRFKLALSAF